MVPEYIEIRLTVKFRVSTINYGGHGGRTVFGGSIAMSWVKIEYANTEAKKPSDGVYDIRFAKGRLPREAVVEAGTSEIPSRHTRDQPYLLQANTNVGVGGAPLCRSDLI